MKAVVGVIKSSKLEEVKDSLESLGISGMTITDVRGAGHEEGHTEVYRGAEYHVDFTPRTRIEVVCRDAMSEVVVRAIAATASTGTIGDGKVWVVPAETVVRVGTGERDDNAV